MLATVLLTTPMYAWRVSFVDITRDLSTERGTINRVRTWRGSPRAYATCKWSRLLKSRWLVLDLCEDVGRMQRM